MKSQQIEQQLKMLPDSPGVYLYRDDRAVVLYVGKAGSLRNRVRSYFGAPSSLLPKVASLVGHISTLETIVTDSELEALILESNLIKRYRPHYNIMLKDDKSYPFLKITLGEDWPKIQITRKLERDGSRYFGPFASAASIRTAMDAIRKVFPYCTCNKPIKGPRSRPCLAYHLGRCPGVTIGAISQEDYRENIRQLIMFLDGRQEQILRQMRQRMENAAEKLEFETAAFLRDQVQALEAVRERQKVAVPLAGDQDVIAMAQNKDEACVQVFFVRKGNLIGREHFLLQGTRDEEPGQIVASFMEQFYSTVPYIPGTVLLQHEPADPEVMKSWLETQRGGKVSLKTPARGEKKKFVEMVAENARQFLEQERAMRLADGDRIAAALNQLKDELHLPRLPQRIECYDISDIQGTSAVGSMVVFEKGLPKRAHYRRFRIKTVEGANDYAMLQEVLLRRFKRAPLEGEGSAWGIVPDLVLIDGGKGQLNVAREAMRLVGADDVPVAGIAKENEWLFLPARAEPVVLPRNSEALFLVQRIRDEAHRFAVSYHTRVRQKAAITSGLDTVPGIGPKRKRALLKKFGSVRGVKEASIEDIAAVPGMTRASAQKVKEYL